MEKKIAHYSLESIKKLIAEEKYFITKNALVDADSLGFSEENILDVILNLTVKDLYKSMTTYADNKRWQDVYFKYENKIELYIKLQITQEAIIISFKERT